MKKMSRKRKKITNYIINTGTSEIQNERGRKIFKVSMVRSRWIDR